MQVKVLRDIMAANDSLAAQIRAHFEEHHVLTLNLISAPGSGKTTLLEKTIAVLKQDYRIGVIEGDIATSKDAERIAALDVPVVQLNTGGACHLEANNIFQALHEVPLDDLDILFIENVGNMVCPAEFDVGEAAKVAILSVTEGADKPAKYPLLFHEAACLVLTKIDLLPYVPFDEKEFHENVYAINGDLEHFEVSAMTGEGMQDWLRWVRGVREGTVELPTHPSHGGETHTHVHGHSH